MRDISAKIANAIKDIEQPAVKAAVLKQDKIPSNLIKNPVREFNKNMEQERCVPEHVRLGIDAVPYFPSQSTFDRKQADEQLMQRSTEKSFESSVKELAKGDVEENRLENPGRVIKSSMDPGLNDANEVSFEDDEVDVPLQYRPPVGNEPVQTTRNRNRGVPIANIPSVGAVNNEEEAATFQVRQEEIQEQNKPKREQATEEFVPNEVEMESYCLFVNNNFIDSFASKEDLEEVLKTILLKYKAVSLRDITVLKRLNVRTGLFVD